MATDAKSYLISFVATLKGNKAVLKGLKSMKREIKKMEKGMGVAGKKALTFGQKLTEISKRALLTIPAWLVLRGAFMGLIRTVGDVVRSNVQLEEQMARIRTVMHGTAVEIESDMASIKSVIIETAVNSRISLQELAEGFYFLRTANLDTKQAIQAFIPAVNLAIGTGNSLKETARALAGIYNTMGKAIKETTEESEVFARISDVLAFTYATQDVQLSELIASYSKFAPFVSGLDDSFSDIVTTLGFLNTRLLRSGRAGRLTGRAIIQLSKNAEKLASIFGITFDPDKPINFIGVMKKLHSALNTGTKLTERQSKAIQDTFATRGAVPIRLLLESFDEWNKALKLAGENAEGFAEKMRNIRMGTISAQAGRMKNLLAVLGNEFITGATNGESFAKTLQIINDWLERIRPNVKALGDMLGFITTKLGQFSVIADGLEDKDVFGGIENLFGINPKALSRAISEISEKIKGVTLDEHLKQSLEAEQSVKDENKEREKLNDLVKNSTGIEKIRTTELQKMKAEIAHQVKLMKILGAHEKDIAQFKLEQLETLEGFSLKEKEEIERLKAQNALIEAQAKFRKEMLGTMRETATSVLKIMGASESQILEIKIRQLQIDKERLGTTKFTLELTKLRHQQQLALLQEKQKELGIATSLFQKYKQADEFERVRLRRLLELRSLPAEELGKRYNESMFDQRIIDEYFSHFTQQGQNAVGAIIQDMFNLPSPAVPGITELPVDQLRDLLKSPDLSTPFWDNWMVQARDKLKDFREEFGRVFIGGGLGTIGQTVKDRIAIDQNVDLSTKIANIEITLPENALDNVAEEAGNQLREALLSSEDFQKKFVERIRHLI